MTPQEQNNSEWWNSKKETPKQEEKYNGWLNSDNIVKRSLWVYFHLLLWQFFIFLILVWIIAFIMFLAVLYRTIF